MGEQGSLLPVSIVTGCKGRLEYLKRSMGTWLALPVAEVVVVDAGCPQGAGDWAESMGEERVRVVRLGEEGVYQHSRVKNAGARAARSGWLMFLDSDIMVSPAFVDVLSTLEADAFYRADSGADGLAGQVVISRGAYERLGGFDEVYRDYSDEDIDLYRRLHFHRYKQVTFESLYLKHIVHDDGLRTTYQAERNKGVSLLTNTAYGLAKIDLMKILGIELKETFRRQLYEMVKAKTLEAIVMRKPQQLELLLPESPMSGEFSFERKYVVTVNPTGKWAEKK